MLRTDAGAENSICENIQKALRYGQGDDFEGEKIYFMGERIHNQRIESFWAQFRSLVTGFYINFFQKVKGILNTNNRIDVETPRFCFGHLIQYDLNNAKKIWNLHRIRRQPFRDIRGGKPNVLYYLPEMSNAWDYKKPVKNQ